MSTTAQTGSFSCGKTPVDCNSDDGNGTAFAYMFNQKKNLGFIRVEKTAFTPTIATKGSVGYDTKCQESFLLNPHDIRKVETGLKVRLPDGWGALLKERSSLAKKGLCVLDGVIDYEGELFALVTNHSLDQLRIDREDRIFQLILFSRRIDECYCIQEKGKFGQMKTGTMPAKQTRGSDAIWSSGR